MAPSLRLCTPFKRFQLLHVEAVDYMLSTRSTASLGIHADPPHCSLVNPSPPGTHSSPSALFDSLLQERGAVSEWTPSKRHSESQWRARENGEFEDHFARGDREGMQLVVWCALLEFLFAPEVHYVCLRLLAYNVAIHSAGPTLGRARNRSSSVPPNENQNSSLSMSMDFSRSQRSKGYAVFPLLYFFFLSMLSLVDPIFVVFTPMSSEIVRC